MCHIGRVRQGAPQLCWHSPTMTSLVGDHRLAYVVEVQTVYHPSEFVGVVKANIFKRTHIQLISQPEQVGSSASLGSSNPSEPVWKFRLQCSSHPDAWVCLVQERFTSQAPVIRLAPTVRTVPWDEQAHAEFLSRCEDPTIVSPPRRLKAPKTAPGAPARKKKGPLVSRGKGGAKRRAEGVGSPDVDVGGVEEAHDPKRLCAMKPSGRTDGGQEQEQEEPEPVEVEAEAEAEAETEAEAEAEAEAEKTEKEVVVVGVSSAA